jgi:CrcB protein
LTFQEADLLLNFSVYLVIGLGGALGAIARYVLSSWIYQKYFYTFPWGTFVVNMLGCFVLGIVYVLGVENLVTSPNTRLFISVGFLGAFTTFSTLSLETLNLIKSGEIIVAVLNGLGSLLVGLIAVWLGMSLTQLLLK